MRSTDLFLSVAPGVVIMQTTLSSLLSVTELADYLKLSPGSIYVFVHKKSPNIPPFFRIGNRLVWHIDVVDAWVRAKAGIFSASSQHPPGSPLSPVFPKKKRGRPTKGEAAAKVALKTAGGGK